MESFKIFRNIFSSIGAGLLLIAFFVGKNTYEFLGNSIETRGTVVDMYSVRSSSSSGTSTTYKPKVHFYSRNGKLFEFVSSTSSNPPAYEIGEKVDVLYNPKSPGDAKIKGFFSLWGATFILGIIGTFFFLMGFSLFISIMRKKKRKQDLIQYGTKILSDIQRVEINPSVSINGKHPWRIVSQWKNPESLQLHIFTCDNLWFDPTSYIKNDKIEVLIDRTNPQKYLVDLSFLPEVLIPKN